MRRSIRAGLVAAGLLVPSAALACLWDYDTLRQERSRFPDALELITGKFLRHSPEFYEWRIADRKRRLESNPNNLALYDDLAVAYDKTGRHELAIETIRAKDKLKPGLYETEANLGTFLIHAGRLKEGLVHLGNAVRINPHAHFGREKYQKALVEYVVERGGAKKLPVSGINETLRSPGEQSREPIYPHFPFASFLRPDRPRSLDPDQRSAAIKGVLGMMRFGRHDSPVLLEALGSLLAEQYDVMPEDNAKRLAARAYLKASYEAKEEPAKAAYRGFARATLTMQTRHPRTTTEVTLEEIEDEFRQELADAREWYEALRQKELGWIRDGKDPEREFDKLYAAEPQVAAAEPAERDDDAPVPDDQLKSAVAVILGIVAGLFVLAVVSVWVLVQYLVTRRAAAIRTPPG